MIDEKQRLIEKFDNDTIIEKGVIRWKSNNQVPPDDVLQVWVEAGKSIDLQKCQAASSADMEVFVEQYRKNRAHRTPDQIREEQADQLAAFGSGVTVINIVTGETHVTGVEESDFRMG